MNILFLCAGNSCRSQMAEGYLRHLAGDRVEAHSAGLEAHGLNPRAIAVMREVDVDISEQFSTVVTDEMVATANLIVTVCGHADQHCPSLPAESRRIHWPLPDPARAEGTDEEIMAAFRAVRDEIAVRVTALIDEHIDGVSP